MKSELAVFDPTVADLVDAAKEAGYDPLPQETAEQVRYPRIKFLRSG
jgi:signal recognition particle subunit SEC65